MSELERHLENTRSQADRIRRREEWEETHRARSSVQVLRVKGTLSQLVQDFWVRVPESEKVTGYLLHRPLEEGQQRSVLHPRYVHHRDLAMVVEGYGFVPMVKDLVGSTPWWRDHDRAIAKARQRYVDESVALWRKTGKPVSVVPLTYGTRAGSKLPPTVHAFVAGDDSLIGCRGEPEPDAELVHTMARWLNDVGVR